MTPRQRLAVADFIRDNFVGLVMDGYIADGYGQKGHHCPEDAAWYGAAGVGNNTWSFATASGKSLGGLHETNVWKAAEAFKSLPEAERRPPVKEEPDPEKGIANLRPPPGGLVARLYNTALDRRGSGELARAARVFTDCYATSAGCVEPALTQIDMLWMTAGEVRSLVPAEAKVGASFRVPEILERRMIAHTVPCANPIGDRGELTLTATDVSPEGVGLRLDGWSKQGPSFLESKAAYGKVGKGGKPSPAPNGQATRWLGFLKYDAKKKAFTRFDVLAVGDVWGETFNRKHGTGAGAEPQRWPTGYAFELAGPCAADRITPPVIVQNSLYNGGFSQMYWGK